MEALAAIRREYVRDLKTPTYVMYPESEGREALPIDIDADQLHSDQSGYD